MLKRIQDLDRLREEKQAKRPTGHSYEKDIIDNRNKSTMIRQLITEFPCLMSPKKGL